MWIGTVTQQITPVLLLHNPTGQIQASSQTFSVIKQYQKIIIHVNCIFIITFYLIVFKNIKFLIHRIQVLSKILRNEIFFSSLNLACWLVLLFALALFLYKGLYAGWLHQISGLVFLRHCHPNGIDLK